MLTARDNFIIKPKLFNSGSICFCRVIILCLLLVLQHFPSHAQIRDGAAEIYAEKKAVLNYLSQPNEMEKFGNISDSIWYFAELGMQEYKSAGLLSETLAGEGFRVEMGLAGMPTCFVASYGTGKPVIAILVEFDALPMLSQKGMVAVKDPLVNGAPGHGCGHNVMGTASVAAAIAVKHAMERYDFKGTVKVFGSPAEETLISRPYMIRAGLFEGVDAVIDNHSSSNFGTRYGVYGNALYSTQFTFHGTTAHSANSPWSGRSALDAVELMNIATNFLREHLHYGYRMHYVITEGGEAPNVVPDRASVWYFVRNSDERIKGMYEKVLNCAAGAALATGTELYEIRCLTAIHQRHANKAAAELFQKNIEIVGIPEWTDKEQEFARDMQKNMGLELSGLPLRVDSLRELSGPFVGGGSSDVGDVTLIAPTASILLPGIVPGAIPHHWSTVSSNFGSIARKGMIAGAKAIAASAVDLLTKPEELQKLRTEFEAYSREHPYEPFLPEDAIPPVDLNRELMEKWRPLMEEELQ